MFIRMSEVTNTHFHNACLGYYCWSETRPGRLVSFLDNLQVYAKKYWDHPRLKLKENFGIHTNFVQACCNYVKKVIFPLEILPFVSICGVSFHALMSLLLGVYFIGSGIWSPQEPVRLHQVLDFTMFRVLPQGDNFAFGYFDISTEEPNFTLI